MFAFAFHVLLHLLHITFLYWIKQLHRVYWRLQINAACRRLPLFFEELGLVIEYLVMDILGIFNNFITNTINIVSNFALILQSHTPSFTHNCLSALHLRPRKTAESIRLVGELSMSSRHFGLLPPPLVSSHFLRHLHFQLHY